MILAQDSRATMLTSGQPEGFYVCGVCVQFERLLWSVAVRGLLFLCPA